MSLALPNTYECYGTCNRDGYLLLSEAVAWASGGIGRLA